MNKQLVMAGAGLLALTAAATAQDRWPVEGWAPGGGSGMGLGRMEGPVTADIWQADDGLGVSVTVTGCGGVGDFRTFGTAVIGGDGQARAASGALARLLGEARRACGFEERLAARLGQGVEPAFAVWIQEQAEMEAQMNMTDMGVDMNATECSGDCNMM